MIPCGLWIHLKHIHGKDQSQVSWQTDGSMFKSNNTKNIDRANKLQLQALDPTQIQQLKQTVIIQCYNCDNTMRLKGFNKHHINDHNARKQIEYYKYNVAIKAEVLSNIQRPLCPCYFGIEMQQIPAIILVLSSIIIIKIIATLQGELWHITSKDIRNANIKNIWIRIW